MRKIGWRGTLTAVAIAVATATGGAHADPAEDTIDVARVAVDRTIEAINTAADSIVAERPISPIMGKIIITHQPGDRAPKATIKYAFENTRQWDCFGSHFDNQPVIIVCEPLTREDWRCINVVTAEATTAAGVVRGQLDCDGRAPWALATGTVRGSDPVTKDVAFGPFGLPAVRVICVADDGRGGEPTPGYVVTCGG